MRAALLLAAALAGPAAAAAPARDAWRASSSADESDTLGPALAIDGRSDTRWSSPYANGHWLAVDLGRRQPVCGVAMRWDAAYARHWRLQASDDGRRWRTLFETRHGAGGDERVFFPTRPLRHLRLVGVQRATGWGISLHEFEPLGDGQCARIEGRADGGLALWGAARAGMALGAAPLEIDLRQRLPLAGLEVTWAQPPRTARLQGRGSDGWRDLAQDVPLAGHPSRLAARQAAEVDALRLHTDGPARVAALRLMGPGEIATPLARLEDAARRAPRGQWPAALRREQVYWTTVGLPGALQKSVLDEHGNVEAAKGAPLLQPLLAPRGGGLVGAAAAQVSQALHEGWMPLPRVTWRAAGVPRLDIQAVATGTAAAPVTRVRYRLSNAGPAPLAGRFILALRPLQASPAWQNGGLAPVAHVAVAGGELRVGGRALASAWPQPQAAAAAALDDGDPAAWLATGRAAPPEAADADGLTSAALSWPYALRPGEHTDVLLRLPLADGAADDDTGFDAAVAHSAAAWRERLQGLQLALPEPAWADALRAQVAYTLLNQGGAALMPGPRNYDRSFMRDGASSVAVLLRAGLPGPGREFLQWYERHGVHADGLVSPILNTDGSVNRGFGSDLEYDSQGQFVWLVAELARLDGGPETVRAHRAAVRRALQHLVTLRERTLAEGYLAERAAPERFRGILPPSISHEGYATPQHSYWDDYWALRGWADGAWLFGAWGDAADAAWAREQHTLLRDALAASVRATMRWKGIATVPSSADLGDPDPTGVATALEPTRQSDVLPRAALERTFDDYARQALPRLRQRGGSGAYTPYEFRNVPALVRLGRPEAAWRLMQALFADRRPPAWHVWAEVVHADARRAAYLGDMPHTWVGAEYAHALWSLLLREGATPDEPLHLLPAVPAAWLAGDGVRVSGRATPHGTLGFSARQRGRRLVVELAPGLAPGTEVRLSGPAGPPPRRVQVDGRDTGAPGAGGVALRVPFTRVELQW